jgi:hypothetical protein
MMSISARSVSTANRNLQKKYQRRAKMSLDVTLTAVRKTAVFDANITHNLTTMAEKAGIYEYLWTPEKIGIEHAAELIEPLSAGLKLMKEKPEYFKQFEPENGWGSYHDFVPWIENYIKACKENPDAGIEVRR